MKVEIMPAASPAEEKAVIHAAEVTENIRKAAELLEGIAGTLVVYRDDQALFCETKKIYYIESVDDKCFVYTKNECFETKYRLYELEDTLGSSFLRCSKSMICDIRKIKSVRAELNARMSAALLNGEEIIISRSYVKDFKKRLGL